MPPRHTWTVFHEVALLGNQTYFLGIHITNIPVQPTHYLGHAFQINSFGAEKTQILAKENLNGNRETICCSHCHKTVGSGIFVHLMEHRDAVGIVTRPTSGNVQQIREHWYWNPSATMLSLYRPFFYAKP
ncbi:hypothetical protein BDP27DRAFT_1419265 [Rhodocollybia butyracea]|uniref:Uncharacterized protein n=1 Tax=Rhodocollybia butyracea TaxID=206335 RepID=A0A9P5PXT8_9AGAR|nr:hypothetical protein BDP27DRAFT_1419265 [Rhodocollybia butyracea]